MSRLILAGFSLILAANATATPVRQIEEPRIAKSSIVLKLDPQHRARISELTCDNAHPEELLKELFNTSKLKYQIAPDVQGTVTMSLKKVSFKVVLLSILRQLDAMYHVWHGVYYVEKKVWPVVKSNQTPIPISNTVLRFDHTEIRQAMRQLFANSNMSYQVDPDVHATVTGELKNATFENELDFLTRSNNLTYRIVGGIYIIVNRPKS